MYLTVLLLCLINHAIWDQYVAVPRVLEVTKATSITDVWRTMFTRTMLLNTLVFVLLPMTAALGLARVLDWPISSDAVVCIVAGVMCGRWIGAEAAHRAPAA